MGMPPLPLGFHYYHHHLLRRCLLLLLLLVFLLLLLLLLLLTTAEVTIRSFSFYRYSEEPDYPYGEPPQTLSEFYNAPKQYGHFTQVCSPIFRLCLRLAISYLRSSLINWEHDHEALSIYSENSFGCNLCS